MIAARGGLAAQDRAASDCTSASYFAVEPQKYVTSTNRHFAVRLTDAQYRQAVAEMQAWRDAPGKFYSLDDRNCIHFVGKMAQIAGLKVDYSKKLLRKPKNWLNYITGLNPKLGATVIK